jgi:hypothetical protein
MKRRGGEIFMKFTKNNLRSIPRFRQFLVSLEAKYTEDKLNALVSRQNQSPYSSIHWTNLNYLTVSEILALTLIGFSTNSDVVRIEILEKLPGAIERHPEEAFGGPIGKAVLLRVIQDHIKRKLPFYRNRQKAFFRRFPLRKLLGLLSDPVLQSKLQKRFRPILWTPARAKRGQRIRGYRDHGTCRPSHKWIPRFDFSLTRQQWSKEQLRKLDLEFYEIFLNRPFNLCFSS